MNKGAITIIAIILSALIVTAIHQDLRITNLERQQLRIEQEYQAVITENHKLIRMNEASLRLMAQGGWNEVSSDITFD